MNGYTNRLADWLVAIGIVGSLLVVLCVAGAVEWGRAKAEALRLRTRRASLASHRGTRSRLADVRELRGGVEGLGSADMAGATRLDARASAAEVGIAPTPLDVAENGLTFETQVRR